MTTTVKPNSFRADSSDNFFFNSKDLQEYDPVFYYGCKTKPRNILQKKNVPTTEYLYANFNARDGAWILSSNECKKAQLLISKNWVDIHMHSMQTDRSDIATPVVLSNIITPVPLDEVDGDHWSKYQEVPPLMELDDTEKFHDSEGNILEIETRGTERREDVVFFRCSDVSIAFNMPSLNGNITRDRSGYEENTDYKYFKGGRSSLGLAPPNKTANANPFYLYLTYEGLLRVLFVSRNKHATSFRKWATAILFTHQMGVKDAKNDMAANLAGIDRTTFKAVFDGYASTFPCIYLMRLGPVKSLRNTFDIKMDVMDDLIVYKYGFTQDLGKRFQEHTAGYGKMPGVSLKLSTFHVIDTKYTAAAEGEVRAFVKKTYQLIVPNHKELIAMSDEDMKYLKTQYGYIGQRYAGATASLTKEIAELKTRIKELEDELVAKDLMYANNLQKEQYEHKLTIMQRDTNAERFGLKEENYLLKIQLLTQQSTII